jgi:ankyrin repeat protein
MAAAEQAADEAADVGRLGKDLIKAVEDKDVNKINELLQQGADVNFKDENEYSVLIHAAINHSDIEQESIKYANIVRILLANGADINAKDEQDYTALRFAAADNNIETVKALLEANNPPADPNIQDNMDEKTALHVASEEGHVEIVKLLLTLNNIDLSIKADNGMTAKQIANMGGHHDIVGLLEQAEQKRQRMGGRRHRRKTRRSHSRSKKQRSRRRR